MQSEGNTELPRVKFYGLDDIATFHIAQRAMTVLSSFDQSQASYNVSEVVELSQAARYVERGVFPTSMDTNDQERFNALLPNIRKAEGKFFNGLTESSFASNMAGVDNLYRTDVLESLAKFRVFDRLSPTTVLGALRAEGFTVRQLLSCQALVRAYDGQVRSLILAATESAEIILTKHLLEEPREAIHLPASLTTADRHELINAYVAESNSNPTYLKLVAEAGVGGVLGVDAKLKLKAKRAYQQFTNEFFTTNNGIRTRIEVSITDGQVEDAEVTALGGLDIKFSFSRDWLVDNLDYPTVLNNFVYVFEWATYDMLLTLPSYRNEMGTIEMLFMMGAKDAYLTGTAYRLKDGSTLLQAQMYRELLRTEGVELEDVISWFFSTHVREQFGIENMIFRPSSESSTYLERCRHLFSEMESVLKQFKLHVEHGEIDLELLSMTSEQLAYGQIPSNVPGKYLYVAVDPTIDAIQHLLFSDQSGLGYIDPELNADNLATLLQVNRVAYDRFKEHQKGNIDFLIFHEIVVDEESHIKIANSAQFQVLKNLHEYEATSYWHHTSEERAQADVMLSHGWLEHRSTLLTISEAAYVNYWLNHSGPSGGPDLRNQYIHGSQADGDDKSIHFHTYLVALRLLIAFVIKMNDDLRLRDDNHLPRHPGPRTDSNLENRNP